MNMWPQNDLILPCTTFRTLLHSGTYAVSACDVI